MATYYILYFYKFIGSLSLDTSIFVLLRYFTHL